MILRPWTALVALVAAVAMLWLIAPHNSDLAELAARAGAWDQAAELLERASQEHPADARLKSRLIEAYAHAGRHEAALAALEAEARTRALSPAERTLARAAALAAGQPRRGLRLLTGPNQAATQAEWPPLVDLALQAGELKLARKVQSLILKVHPQDPEAIARTRDLALADTDLASALVAQRTLYALAPSPANGHQLEGLLLQAGRPAEALAVHETLSALPGDLGWYVRAAQLAAWAKQPERAVPFLMAIYQASHAPADAHKLLGALAATRHPAAAATARLVLEQHERDRAVAREAEGLLVALGRADVVLDVRLARVGRAPDDVAAHRSATELAMQLGRHDVALAELGRWLKRRPNDLGDRHRLAQVLAWDGQLTEARRAYMALLPHARWLGTATETRWLGEWLAVSEPTLDRTPIGLSALERLVTLTPGRLDARRRLAEALWAREDREEAVAQARRVATDAQASRDDRVRLGLWLLDAGGTAEGLTRLARLDHQQRLAPQALARAAFAAGDSERWRTAGYFFRRYADVRPTEPLGWEGLAWARERSGDLTGAIAAWKRRLAIAAPNSARVQAARLLEAAGKPDEAYRWVAPVGSVDGLRLRVRLASALERPDEALTALRALVALRPDESSARLALADGLARRGDRAAARLQCELALARAPGDAEVLVGVAARMLAFGTPGRREALMNRLASLPRPGPEALRLLASYEQGRSPERAARWLDALHQQVTGDAASWLLRGDLAARLGQARLAEEAYTMSLAYAVPGRVDEQEARAMALERLGRTEEALGAWHALADAAPERLAAPLALATHYLQTGDLNEAQLYVDQARAAAPGGFEGRLLAAQVHLARGNAADALPLLAALHAEAPRSAFITATEAQAHARLGQLRLAHERAFEAAAIAPADEGLRAMARAYREQGANRVGVEAGTEALGTLVRTRTGVGAEVAVDDRFRLGGALKRLDWTGAAFAQEATLSARYRTGPWRADAQVALANQGGMPQAPFGQASLRWAGSHAAAGVGLGEARWEESIQSVQGAGRERRAGLDLSWRPVEPVTLRAAADVGALSLHGAPVGTATTLVGEASARVSATSPWSLNYAWRDRRWGQAGAMVGLPAGLSTHTVAVGFNAGQGPWRVEVQPGYVLEMLTGSHAPSVSGALVWEPGLASELRLSGAWSGVNVLQGGSGDYRRLELTGHWWF